MKPRYLSILEKATVIDESETDWVYDPFERGYQDGHFESVDDMRDTLNDCGDWVLDGKISHYGVEGAVWVPEEGAEMPPFVFATNSYPVMVNIDRVIEDVLEDHHETVYEHLVDVRGLERFIAEWNAKQTACSYYVDYKRVVILDQDAYDKYVEELRGQCVQ